MIKCKYFRKTYEYDYIMMAKVEYSAMLNFNRWDQSDVQRIISIDTLGNEHGEVETIVVYYEVKEKDD